MVRSGEELGSAYALRTEVFCDEQGVSSAEEFDGLDPGAIHIVGVEGGAVVATCRLLCEGEGVCRLGRMAVAEHRRGQGDGRRLMAAAEAEARSAGAGEIVLHAQRRAVSFYAGRGFGPEGETFIEAKIPHVKMRKRISRG